MATVATAVFGGLTPYLSQALIDTTGWRLVPGAMVAGVALLAMPILWRLPETAPTRLAAAPRSDLAPSHPSLSETGR